MRALALSGTSMLANYILIALLLMPRSFLWCEGDRMVKPEGLHLFLEFPGNMQLIKYPVIFPTPVL